MKKFLVFLCATLLILSVASAAKAVMVMELSGDSGSSIVDFTLSGWSVDTITQAAPYLGGGFDIYSGPDLFPPGISPDDGTYGLFSLLTGGGAWVNETTGLVSPIDGIWLQDQSLFGTVERFGVSFSQHQFANTDDVISWNGSGTFDLSSRGLTFGDLNLGEALGQDDYYTGLYGEIRIKPIPEPATMLLLGTGLIGLAGFRRKFRKK